MIEDFGNANFQAILLQTIITFSRRVFSLRMANLKLIALVQKPLLFLLTFIREFIAIVVMYKRRHIIVCGLFHPVWLCYS